MKKYILVALLFSTFNLPAQQVRPVLYLPDYKHGSPDTIQPLQQLGIANERGTGIKVFDGAGKEYFSSAAKPAITFLAGGALGKQTIRVYDQNKITDSIVFYVDAKTNIDDGGYYKNMFDLFYKGMFVDNKTGTDAVTWNGKTYNVFVQWVLDNYHTMKGMKYFMPNGNELVDIMRQTQRNDGMIYSFVQYMDNADYFLTRDKFSGYSKPIGDRVFVRQPTENHPEYIYVNTIYDCWKSMGDDKWMKENLASAAKALDYAPHDPARWSNRFGLLKRVYTIDSWDFAVEDEYMPNIGITNSMIIDPDKSKFGVFFGDNTGYITACYQLAEMFETTGDKINAKKYRQRGNELADRLNKLTWNGNFFIHFIDEDSTVHRNLGVDERSQVAQSNAYSLNRNITHEQSKAIIETYISLKNNLPVGSPGEWYAIYPPFQKGFTLHDAVWQYMNAGVGGHNAGELARGAYENGYEIYATDILNRIFELGRKYSNKISFAYTGSITPPPSSPFYKTIDIATFANMDISNTNTNATHTWMHASRPGDDLHDLPVGEQLFDNIKFNIIDPSKNNRSAVIAVSNQTDFPPSMEIPVNDTAACIYLLHTASKPSSENVAGAVKILYEDGSNYFQYMMMGKQLVYWWFSELKTDHSGIAWYGKNNVSEGVGISWCAIDNPHPKKKIKSIMLSASQNDNIYAVLAITLSDQKHYVPVNPVSFGGPDDWAAATNMAAMVEGLAGVKDASGTEAFKAVVLAPRWTTTNADSVYATIRYAASKGYASYKYVHNKQLHTITITTTTGGDKMNFHVLMPGNAKTKSVIVNGKNTIFKQSTIEQSGYTDFEIDADSVKTITISYE